MNMTKRIVLTLLLVLGMAMLGTATGLIAPAVPAVAGFAVALACSAAVTLGQAGGALGMLAYGGGLCAAMLLLQPRWMGLAVWYAVFMLIGYALTQVQLHKKLPLVQVMEQTAAWLMVVGVASYISLYYTFGDGVGIIVSTLESELEAIKEISPQMYDAMLSTLSVRGFLPDVGLENYVLELDAHSRVVLTAALTEFFDESLRLSVIDILVSQAMHIGLIAPLMTVMAYARKGEGERVSKMPDLAQVHLPRQLATILFVLVLACMVLMLFVKNAAPVYVAGMTVFEFIYAVQGLSMGEWFLRRRGMNRAPRMFILGAVFVLFPGLLFFIGFIEQIFHYRELQKLKDSGEWQKMHREYEAYMEDRQKEIEEEKERRKAERKRDDDDDFHKL